MKRCISSRPADRRMLRRVCAGAGRLLRCEGRGDSRPLFLWGADIGFRPCAAISQRRHSREGGLCFTSAGAEHPGASASSPQVVIPAKAGIQRLQRHLSKPSFPRTPESSDFRRSRTKGPGFPRSRE
ncbi:hypothetical protein [Lysobacter gummosus]|uniref:hypothetical protein n=1 Tax=Lysobacter gummosus TaxID=262324 RepID=UPI003628020A